jgi:hypothetical protein
VVNGERVNVVLSEEEQSRKQQLDESIRKFVQFYEQIQAVDKYLKISRDDEDQNSHHLVSTTSILGITKKSQKYQ